MAIAMTEAQEHEFEEQGFVILENFLTPKELVRLSNAVDEVELNVFKRKRGWKQKPISKCATL